MAKKATGLAAFTRPKVGAESLVTVESEQPAVDIPTPRRKREGVRLSRLPLRSGDRIGNASVSLRMQRERRFRLWPKLDCRRCWRNMGCRRLNRMQVNVRISVNRGQFSRSVFQACC